MKKVFVSYCHKDESWKDRVVSHLGVLVADGQLDLWDDRRIGGGDDWFPAIEQAIQACDVALLLVSADFLTSKFILKEEVPRLLRRRAGEGCRVIPVILRPCAWTKVSWLKGIQARPKDGRPLSKMTRAKADTTGGTRSFGTLRRRWGRVIGRVPATSAMREGIPPPRTVCGHCFRPQACGTPWRRLR